MSNHIERLQRQIKLHGEDDEFTRDIQRCIDELQSLRTERDRLREALQGIYSNNGMCIYGNPSLIDANDDVKQAFRDGSYEAFKQCACLADNALQIRK